MRGRASKRRVEVRMKEGQGFRGGGCGGWEQVSVWSHIGGGWKMEAGRAAGMCRLGKTGHSSNLGSSNLGTSHLGASHT